LDPIKRRQFDSVDEGADVSPPTKKQTQKGDFFKLWNPVFESEARFSRKQPVPMLGNGKSSKEEVEAFYDFWYNFDSWRSFEYQDEDVPDDNESRDQRRHIERKNANARKKKKVEDTARLRKVVDQALELDERIKRFRKEDQLNRNRKKIEKEAEEKKRKAEEAKRKEQEAKEAAEKAEKEKAEKADAKKAKEAAKNVVKKNKRVVRGAIKDANYFHEGEGEASAKEIDASLNDVDVLLGRIGNEELADLVAKLNGKTGVGEIKLIFGEEISRLKGEGKVKDGEMKALGG
jgi:DnaJ homolog subfamily C member 2